MKVYNKIVFSPSTGKVLEEDSFEYDGLVAQCKGGGGGGSSGKIEYPSFIEDLFKELWGNSSYPDAISTDLSGAIDTAITNNPYDSETAFDPNATLTLVPTSPLKTMQDGHDQFDTLITALDESTDWDTLIANAVAEVDGDLSETDIDTQLASFVTTAFSNANSLLSNAITQAAALMTNSNISDIVTAYENEQTAPHLRQVGRVAAGLADVNSVEGSAYPFVMGYLSTEFDKQVEKFRQELKYKAYDMGIRSYVEGFIANLRIHAETYIKNHLNYNNLRVQMINAGIAEMAGLLKTKISAYQASAALQAEISRISVVALKEQTDKDLEIDALDARWDYNLILQAGNLLSNIAGGSAGFIPEGPSPVASAIGGTLSGAAAGAAAGSIIPGIGTVTGAIVGGVGGFLSEVL